VFFRVQPRGDRKPQKFGLEKPAMMWFNLLMNQTEPHTMKVIGRQGQAKVDVDRAGGFLKMAQELHRGNRFIPKGVWRFKTHEEADEWMLRMITRR